MMAIFSRRILQHMINENAKVLSIDQTRRHVEALNKADEKSLASEWEVVLLYGLNKLGKLTHEADLGGTRKLDLYFVSNTEPRQSFVADITTVSDKGLGEKNPTEAFQNELMRNIKIYRLKANCFSYEAGGKTEGPYPNQKMKLRLPVKGKLQTIFKDRKFKDFLEIIVQKPQLSHSFALKTDFIEVLIRYNPKQECFTASWPSYTSLYSLEKNPIYNTLKMKIKQLKGVSYNGYKGIILCDGGCDSLYKTGYAGLSYGVQHVIQHFFRQNTSVSFVIVCIVETYRTRFPIKQQQSLEIKTYRNPYAPEKLRLSEELLTCIEKLEQVLPQPVMTAKNVINNLRYLRSIRQNEGVSFYGGWEMTTETIRISARALLQLLAGKVSQEKFFRDHDFPHGNPFEQKLCKGRTIKSIKIEKTAKDDDDWLIFEFGDTDPAIFKFICPKPY